MANNPYVNKVVYGNDTVMDISDTTAEAADVASGKKFYTSSGAPALGTGTNSTEWGDITGTLSDQTDLQDALDEKTGKNLEYQTVHPTSTTTVIAGTGAEIFNDYRERTYSGTSTTAGNVASGFYSHAEGERTTASGDYSHAEGILSNASGSISHAEGGQTTASGADSHAEGGQTIASGSRSHAEGSGTTARGDNSHAEGFITLAAYECQHVQGKYNNNKSTTYFEIGNGTAYNARSNAFEVYNDGTLSQDDGATKFKFTKDANNKLGFYDGSNVFHKFNESEATLSEIVRTGVTASANEAIRIPAGSATDSRISTANTCVVTPVCETKSDGTPYLFKSCVVSNGYATITVAEAISNIAIGVQVVNY